MALGFGFGFGRLKGKAVAAIGAPTLAWASAETDARPDFDIGIPVGSGTDAAANDVLRLEYSSDAGSNWSPYLTHTLTSGEIAGTGITVSGVSALSNGAYLFRARIERVLVVSAWSDSEAVTVNAVAVSAGIGWPWLWIPNSGSNAGQPTGPWLWLLQG